MISIFVSDFMYQYAVAFYNQTISKNDIQVTTEIHGEFVLRGIAVKVDYKGDEEELYDCWQAKQMLEDQRYSVTVNDKKLEGMDFSDDDVKELAKILTDRASELGIKIDPASDWNTPDDWENEIDCNGDITGLLHDIEFDGFIESYDIDIVRPEK